MKERSVASLQVGTSRFRDCRTIQLADARDITNPHAGRERFGLLNSVDRGSKHLDASGPKNERIRIEVNQLLTTVRSPVTSIEQDDGPALTGEFSQIDSLAIDVLP